MKYITLSTGTKVKICNCHYELVSNFKWQEGGGYAVREQYFGMKDGKRLRKRVLMHRVIAGTPGTMETDHINRDNFDNRCSNLRIATRSQNCANRQMAKGYKGVMQIPNGKWTAYISSRPKIYLGRFNTKRQALEAYNKKAVEMYGSFAKLNTLESKVS